MCVCMGLYIYICVCVCASVCFFLVLRVAYRVASHDIFSRAHYDAPQGSQQQLEEVWKETDGLVDEKFDPMVFFHLHGAWEKG
jgi:hypothetical protein